MILAIIGKIGTAGGTGHVFEYAGSTFRDMSMEGRMTVCNMSIEAGARAGLVAPDEKTIAYVMGRPYAPKGAAWEQAVAYWRTLPSDPGAKYNKEAHLDAADIAPHVTWGTSPEEVAPITGRVPDPAQVDDPLKRAAMERALEYMELSAEYAARSTCRWSACLSARAPTAASRICAPLRRSPRAAGGRRGCGHWSCRAPVIVKHQAEEEGLDRIFLEAGFEWREPGCSNCMSMNDDRAMNGETDRLDLEPQFRGPPGQERQDPSDGPGDGRRRRSHRPPADVRQLG